MYSQFQLALKYLHYYFTASNGKGHGIHSPFIFQFITRVLNDKQEYDDYENVENLRKQLLKDRTVLTIQDFGAGATIDKESSRSIFSIARNSAKSKKYGQLLFRMVQYFKPLNIIELGTSLGITTSYLAYANPDAKVTTLEGAKAVASVARRNIESLKIKNIDIIEGNFNDTLAAVVSGLSSVDFSFIDGNHKRESTVRYFQLLLPKITKNSILVFDDIHWSSEMEEAWEMIQKHSSVRCSVDLFFMGIIFFHEAFREKQDFKIRF